MRSELDTKFAEILNFLYKPFDKMKRSEEFVISEEFSASLHRHGLAALMAYRMSEAGMKVPAKLAQLRRSVAASVMARRKAEADLDVAFGELGLSAILLKGSSLALRYWPSHLLRSSCDIDLLIPLNTRESVAKVFSSLGYELCSDGDCSQKWTSQSTVFPLDVNYSIRHPEAVNPVFHPPLEEIWNESSLLEGAASLRGMCHSHQILYAAVHAADHAFTRFFWLLDLAFMSADLKDVEALAIRYRCRRALQLALHLSGLLFPGELHPVAAPMTARWFSGKLIAEAESWCDKSVTAFERRLLRLAIVDAASDMLRAVIGLASRD